MFLGCFGYISKNLSLKLQDRTYTLGLDGGTSVGLDGGTPANLIMGTNHTSNAGTVSLRVTVVSPGLSLSFQQEGLPGEFTNPSLPYGTFIPTYFRKVNGRLIILYMRTETQRSLDLADCVRGILTK